MAQIFQLRRAAVVASQKQEELAGIAAIGVERAAQCISG
jgi:hypothetical protein